MDPSEIEFLSESESVRIVPNFNEGILYLLEGEAGPFRAGLPVVVPLWVAVSLRQRHKCRIIQPEWMDADRLEEVKEAEKESQFFTEMPNKHMFVVANLIMDVGIQDLAGADKIRTTLKDIWDIRQAKLRKSVDAFIQSGLHHARLDHLQLIELNSVRPLLPHTMDRIMELEKAHSSIRSTSQATSGSGNDRSLLGNSTLGF